MVAHSLARSFVPLSVLPSGTIGLSIILRKIKNKLNQPSPHERAGKERDSRCPVKPYNRLYILFSS